MPKNEKKNFKNSITRNSDSYGNYHHRSRTHIVPNITDRRRCTVANCNSGQNNLAIWQRNISFGFSIAKWN